MLSEVKQVYQDTGFNHHLGVTQKNIQQTQNQLFEENSRFAAM